MDNNLGAIHPPGGNGNVYFSYNILNIYGKKYCHFVRTLKRLKRPTPYYHFTSLSIVSVGSFVDKIANADRI